MDQPKFLNADIADAFRLLANEWEQRTIFQSSIQQMCMDRAYQRIIGLGPEAVPLILDRMSRKPGQWFWALQAITGQDAVLSAHEGNITAMTGDWLAWGRRRHLLSA